MNKAAWIFAIAAALAACGKSKADQCSKVIEGYNAVGDAMRKGGGDVSDPATVEASAAAIETANKSFAALDVSDSGVKKVRDDLANVFGKHAANLKAMAAAAREGNKDPSKAEAAVAKIKVVGADIEGMKSQMVAAKQALMSECNATSK
jgi:hypothetical protein